MIDKFYIDAETAWILDGADSVSVGTTIKSMCNVIARGEPLPKFKYGSQEEVLARAILVKNVDLIQEAYKENNGDIQNNINELLDR